MKCKLDILSKVQFKKMENNLENNVQNTTPKNKLKLEWVVSFFSLFISVSSFVFIAIQTNIMQSQQKASVWAYLEIHRSISSEGFSLEIQNKGVGPAIIKKVNYIYKKKQYDDFVKLAKDIIVDKKFNYTIFTTNPINKKVLFQTEKIRIFSVKEMQFAAILVKSDFKCQITYETIYGDGAICELGGDD